MSYEDLWDSFHDVKKYWLDNKQTFEAYLELIKYHWTIGKKNIKYFEKLQTFNFFKLTKGSLQPISEKIKTFYSEQVSIYKNFTESLQNSVIQSIRDTLTNQEQTFKETTEKCKKLENDQKKLKKNLESSKEKYFKCCRETLLAIKNKADYITKEAQSLETYIKSIDTLNRFDMTFIEEMRKNMQIYQMTESSRFESLYDSMNKFHEFFISLSSQSLPLLESLSPTLYSFNPSEDLNNFITATKKTHSISLTFLEPSPYGSTCSVPDQRQSEPDQVLQIILIKSWEGLSVSQNEIDAYKALIEVQEHRKSWLYFMNEKRIKSQFQIHPQGFHLMEDLIGYLLDKIAKDSDEHSAKLAIVMSQTFFMIKDNDKYYLHNSLSSHQIWSNQEIWVLMIEDGIKNEMANYLKFCIDETSEEHRAQVSSLMISQLSSYVHIMKTFGINKDFINSIADNLKDRYHLEDLNFSEFLES